MLNDTTTSRPANAKNIFVVDMSIVFFLLISPLVTVIFFIFTTISPHLDFRLAYLS